MTAALRRILSLAEKATPGPWAWKDEWLAVPILYEEDGNTERTPSPKEIAGGRWYVGTEIIRLSGADDSAEQDRELIACADPTLIKALVNEVLLAREYINSSGGFSDLSCRAAQAATDAILGEER